MAHLIELVIQVIADAAALLSFDKAVYGLGFAILESVGVKDPRPHETWCWAVGFIAWMLLLIGSVLFVTWLFNTSSPAKG